MPHPFFHRLRVKVPSRLVRYFVIAGILFFTVYILQWGGYWSFILIGPPIYLAHFIQNSRFFPIQLLELPPIIRDYIFLLPIAMVYYGSMGFILKKLLAEKSKIGYMVLVTFILFAFYIHYKAWDSLSGYYEPFPYP